MEAIFAGLLFVVATVVGVVWVILYLHTRNEMIKLNKEMQKDLEERR